jgi:cytochrome o ubiquinol oxidase subunit 1
MVAATWAIVLLSFVVWLHHFFTMGAGADVNAFFGVMTMIIAIPTGAKVFNWLFTMYKGRIRFTTPMLWFLGFMVTFTIGGVAGVMMAVPPVDFQLHNSLFLVAHFHTMIVGGVVFGFFAGITYWFPKIFGFTLNERLGRYAFWCWFFGFLLAFIPLYILGMMGATRRLDHYDASMGWQGLFIVAACGVCLVGLGIGFQLLQVGYSIWKRKEHMDTTGDPWNARTLEWSTTSPAPFYNFAVLPQASERDAFWVAKQHYEASRDTSAKPIYTDIILPKNTPVGMFVGVLSIAAGFGLVWHIYWLTLVAVLCIITLLIVRLTSDDTEYCIPAAEVEKLETAKTARNQA